MSHKFDAMSNQEISELRERRDSERMTLNRLSEELEHIDSETGKGSAQLKAFRRGLAVTEREIKDSQGVIFLFRRKQTEMEEGSSFLFKEIKSRDAELAELNNLKNSLNRNIENVDKDIQEISDSNAALDAENIKLSSRVDEMEAEKLKLSNDISRFLSKTSLDRDKIEEEFNELSASFLNRIAERDAVKQQLSELETAIKDMTEAISGLDEKVAFLEDIKAIQAEREVLKADVEERKQESALLSAKLKELQKMLADNQEQADSLSTENAEQIYTVGALEKEIMVYDKAATGLDSARERLKTSYRLFEESRDALKKLLVDKVWLEKDIRMAEKKVAGLVQVMSSMFIKTADMR
ncbi:MAG TPA: hypothetical protein VMW78_02000 [Anaerolineae bacterium]|nr:hypothetical protein [Anaerolineae bacterium]